MSLGSMHGTLTGRTHNGKDGREMGEGTGGGWARPVKGKQAKAWGIYLNRSCIFLQQ